MVILNDLCIYILEQVGVLETIHELFDVENDEINDEINDEMDDMSELYECVVACLADTEEMDTEGLIPEDIEDMMKHDLIITNNELENEEKEEENEENIKLKLKQKASERRFIEQEIITTEKTYYHGLDTLLNEFIEPMFDKGYIEKKYYKQITSSLPQILQFHKDFLSQLNDKGINGETLISVFNHCIVKNKEKFIDIYLEFIKDYNNMLDLFEYTFDGNLELNAFLKEKRREKKVLSSLLILPVQRVPRYILLLTDLKKNTEETSDDYKDINDGLEMINYITKEINERKRKIENVMQCKEIEETLNGLKEPIVIDNRIFIEQFIFIKKDINHKRLFFLFNDILIISNQKQKVKHILNVRTLDVKINLNDMLEFELISVECRNVIFIGDDMKAINRFKKFVDKWRVKILKEHIEEKNNTFGQKFID